MFSFYYTRFHKIHFSSKNRRSFANVHLINKTKNVNDPKISVHFGAMLCAAIDAILLCYILKFEFRLIM